MSEGGCVMCIDRSKKFCKTFSRTLKPAIFWGQEYCKSGNNLKN